MIRQDSSKAKKIFSLLLLLFLVGLVAACGSKTAKSTKGSGGQKPYKVFGKWYYPISDAKGFKESGVASWYGPKFHGRKTANGETYDMHAMTAAHKTLPFNTLVRVEDLETGKEVTVRINDRGPFVKGRIIDLSYASGKKLGLDARGVAKVKIKAVATTEKEPVDFTKGRFAVQVGSFSVEANARKLAAKLKREGYKSDVIFFDRGDTVFWRVWVKEYTTLEAAGQAAKRLEQAGHGNAVVVAE